MVQATTSVFEKDGKFTIRAIGITTKYLTPIEVENIYKYSVNQHITYRHKHPSQGKGEILGTVTKAEMVEVTDKDGKKYDGVELEADMLDYTANQKNSIEYVKLKQDTEDPVKLSIGTMSFGDSGKAPIDSRPYEYTLTDHPVCKECRIIDINMTDEDEARISELKTSLDAAVGLNTKYETKIATLETKITDFKSKLELEAGKVDAVNKSFEDTLQEKLEAVNKVYEAKFESTAKELEDVKTELDQAKKSPIIAEIFELEQDEMARDGWYANMSFEDLNKRLEHVKKNTPVIKPFVRNAAKPRVSDKVAAYKESINKALEEADPMLKKILRGPGLTPGERQQMRGY